MKKFGRAKLPASPPARELLILLGFFLLTALMTWPWVTRLRDAVADAGDPYMIAWTLWWDYHATFADPLNLFHANVFYPHRYTLAFSEHDYGIALLFFPLFAAGLRPLTVHSFATFCGFAFCGYAAFRLTRTLTNSDGASLVAGIVFAFIPYRFNLLSHLHYLFAGWLPLLLEALVLFARARTWKRAVWLGAAFVMNALTCVTWMVLSLVPLALSLAFLVVRYRLLREREFWLRGGVAMCAASLVLLPFLLPYHYVGELYGFRWTRREAVGNSPPLASWLDAEQRNKLWRGFGARLGGTASLFPGLLPLLLSLAALFYKPRGREELPAAHEERTDARGERHDPTLSEQFDASDEQPGATRGGRAVVALDALAVAALVYALLAAGYAGADGWLGAFFGYRNADRALFMACAALVARLCLAYPSFLRTGARNLRETMRAARGGDALWLGSVWAAAGFLMSLGMNSFFYRFVYDNFFLFRSQRIPARGAMLAYVGLAVLAGLGASRLASAFASRASSPRASRRAFAVFAALALALLFELRAAPLRFERGAVNPDELTLRLKETPMRGGILELPAGRERGYEHLYMLRAADHGRPLVNGTSSFIPPLPLKVEELTRDGPVPASLLDLLEEVPVSYVVVRNRLVAPMRQYDYESFLARAVNSGRLRFVRRFGESDDLYAVVKTEPEARQEAPLPFAHAARDWESLLAENPVYLLGQYEGWSRAVLRFYVATYGRLPRMSEFMPDVRAVGRGVTAGVSGEESKLESNLEEFARSWVARKAFAREFAGASDAEYVERLFANARLTPRPGERESLTSALKQGTETRASVLLRLVRREDFAESEWPRGFVLLHYFGYLRRDPGTPPDLNLDGFDFWIRELEITRDPARVTKGFTHSYEYDGVRKGVTSDK